MSFVKGIDCAVLLTRHYILCLVLVKPLWLKIVDSDQTNTFDLIALNLPCLCIIREKSHIELGELQFPFLGLIVF